MPQFLADVTRWTRKAMGNAERVFQGVCGDMGVTVVYGTPVDTSRFVSNWKPRINITGAAPPVDWERRGTKAAKAAEVRATANRLQLGDTFSLANGLPYGPPLEYGHSRQAPAGMIRVTIQRFQASVQENARKVAAA